MGTYRTAWEKDMRPHTTIVLAWMVFLVALAAGCSYQNADASAGDEKDQARLEVKGSPGTEFTGSCTVGDGEPTKIGGEAPKGFTYDLKAKSLECEVSSDDNLQVELAVGENTHSAQSISGGTLHLTYEHGSISTDTSSTSRSSRGGDSSYARTNTDGPDSKTNEPVTKESRNVSGFEGVELRGVGNLSIEQTGRESLTVEAEKAVIPKLTARVVDGRLIIGPKPNSAIHTTKPINYRLTVKNLRSL